VVSEWNSDLVHHDTVDHKIECTPNYDVYELGNFFKVTEIDENKLKYLALTEEFGWHLAETSKLSNPTGGNSLGCIETEFIVDSVPSVALRLLSSQAGQVPIAGEFSPQEYQMPRDLINVLK